MDIVVCFALFLAAMLFCLVKGFSLAWALLFALVLFFALGLRRGYGAKALVKMAWSKMPKSMIVLRILFFIGLLTDSGARAAPSPFSSTTASASSRPRSLSSSPSC